MFKFYAMLLIISALALNINCKENDKRQQEMKTSVKNGIGISAWGLIFLIITLILLGVAAYYVALFYPIICKKQRKYNRIELTPV